MYTTSKLKVRDKCVLLNFVILAKFTGLYNYEEILCASN